MKAQIVSPACLWKIVHGCFALWTALAVAQPPDLDKLAREAEAQHVADFWIGCETTQCHPSVGSLFRASVKFEVKKVGGREKISSLSDLGRCTQSLVGANQILTNAHCIPDGAKPGDTIPNFYAIFPATTAASDKTGVARPIERVKVKKVVSISDYDPQSQLSTDFAILELEREISGRPIFPIVQRDFVDRQEYRVISMWPLRDYSEHPDSKLRRETPVGALQRYASCRALMNTVIFGFFSEGSGAYFGLFGCPGHQGNSGSPIFNDRDEIVGVVSIGPKTNVEAPVNGKVTEYSMSQDYLKHLADLSQPEVTPRFWLGGTTSKCILRPELCQNQRIDAAQEKAAGERTSQLYDDERDERIQSVVSQLREGIAGSAFADAFTVVSTGTPPKEQIEFVTEPQCPSFSYFRDLRKSLRVAPSQSFEAQVTYRTRTWLMNSAIGPDWKYEFTTKASPDSVRTISVRVTPQVGKWDAVSEVLPDGTTRAFPELCSIK